jgi:hypothetical protein
VPFAALEIQPLKYPSASASRASTRASFDVSSANHQVTATFDERGAQTRK